MKLRLLVCPSLLLSILSTSAVAMADQIKCDNFSNRLCDFFYRHKDQEFITAEDGTFEPNPAYFADQPEIKAPDQSFRAAGDLMAALDVPTLSCKPKSI